MKFPSVQTASKTGQLFDALRERGRPPKVNAAWLQAAGLKSSNDRQFVSVLKFLGIIDGSGKPTDHYDALKQPEWRKALAGLVRTAYQPVFADFPRAHERNREQLVDLFRAKDPASGSDSITRAVTTFTQLCAVADFSESAPSVVTEPVATVPTAPVEKPVEPVSPPPAATSTQPVAVTINISLEIPTTEKGEVYDKLFESMSKHLSQLVTGGNGD